MFAGEGNVWLPFACPYFQKLDKIYCPRCDIFFKDKSDWQDHIIYKNYRAVYAGKDRFT